MQFLSTALFVEVQAEARTILQSCFASQLLLDDNGNTGLTQITTLPHGWNFFPHRRLNCLH